MADKILDADALNAVRLINKVLKPFADAEGILELSLSLDKDIAAKGNQLSDLSEQVASAGEELKFKVAQLQDLQTEIAQAKFALEDGFSMQKAQIEQRLSEQRQQLKVERELQTSQLRAQLSNYQDQLAEVKSQLAVEKDSLAKVQAEHQEFLEHIGAK